MNVVSDCEISTPYDHVSSFLSTVSTKCKRPKSVVFVFGSLAVHFQSDFIVFHTIRQLPEASTDQGMIFHSSVYVFRSLKITFKVQYFCEGQKIFT